MMLPNEAKVTDDEQKPATDPWEQASRTIGNRVKLDPLAHFIGTKIVHHLTDPKDRLNLYSSCHYMNSLTAPIPHEDQNGLYKLELYIVYNLGGQIIDQPRMRLQVNNRMVVMPMIEVVQFLNDTVRGIFGNRIGFLKLGGRWTNLVNGAIPNATALAEFETVARVLRTYEEIAAYVVANFVPQELELHLCGNTIPDAMEMLANRAFTQRLRGLTLRFKTLAAPYNMSKLVHNMVVGLTHNDVYLQKLSLQDEHADERALGLRNVAAGQLELYRKQTSEAIKAHALTLVRLETNWLLGFDQQSFDEMVNKLFGLREVHFHPSPEIPLNFDVLFDSEPLIASQITEINLALNSFQSNELLLVLAAKFVSVKTCRLELFRQTVAEANGIDIAHQIQHNYNLIVQLITTLFNENHNQSMSLTLRGPGILQRKIITILTSAQNAHLLVASVSLGAQSWLYKMQQMEDGPDPNQIRVQGHDQITYGRKPDTVQILME